MATEPFNLMLEHLKHIRHKVDVIQEDVSELKIRMASMEGHMASAIVTAVRHSSELDRLKARVDRIERRLELSET